MTDERLSPPHLSCHLHSPAHSKPISSRSQVAYLLQQGHFLSQQHRHLMSRGSHVKSRDSDSRSTSEQRSHLTTVDVGLEASYIGERNEASCIRIHVPICSERELMPACDIATDARKTFIRRQISPEKRVVKPVEVGLFPQLDKKTYRKFSHRAFKSEGAPVKSSNAFRVKWLVPPLSSQLRKAQKSRFPFKSKPLSEINRGVSPL